MRLLKLLNFTVWRDFSQVVRLLLAFVPSGLLIILSLRQDLLEGEEYLVRERYPFLITEFSF
jgi:hypothetical protein